MMESPNKKILIVTYYWPPSGGSGVQRWLKFVKYLHRAGWEPMVFTPENPSFTTQDASLLKDVPASVEVLRFPIWEPYELFGKLAAFVTGKRIAQTDFVSTGRQSFFQRISTWIRGNLFIPDPRIFWVRPSVKFLSDLVLSNQINTIITTGPPHSIHLIGLRLKKKFPSVRWVADFRDPWSDWDLLSTLSLTRWAWARHRKLERRVLQQADRVITIAPFHIKRLELLGGRPVELITNGFDDEDFAHLQKTRTSHFVIRHIGVVDELRDPRPFLEALNSLLATRTALRSVVRVEFIGNVNQALVQWVEGDPLLASVTSFRRYLPHNELLGVYASTDLLLLVLAHTAIAPGNLPGKFFEYLASGTPILAVGPPQGDASAILQEAKAGAIFEREDKQGMVGFIDQAVQVWQEGGGHQPSQAAAYSRKNLTDKLVRLLESIR
jgi:glycosyltransferase involved in cell wall biosynthesis